MSVTSYISNSVSLQRNRAFLDGGGVFSSPEPLAQDELYWLLSIYNLSVIHPSIYIFGSNVYNRPEVYIHQNLSLSSWLSLTNEIIPHVRQTNQLFTVWNPQLLSPNRTLFPYWMFSKLFFDQPKVTIKMSCNAVVQVTIADK